MDQIYDVVIIGGGINGCGCAADAALRGLTVLLCEQNDLASQTSSSSTKLIHGGLRYLEYFDFALVKKSLDERQILLELAPHLIHPISFILPHRAGMRPIWMLRIGLFLYDHLSRNNQLPKSRLIRRSKQPDYFNPLVEHLNQGFVFYDCTTDDARLTLANAIQAKEHGTTILTQTQLIQAEINNKQWRLTLQDGNSNLIPIKAKTVINAAGPWVESLNQLLKIPLKYPMTLVKGSHVIVHKLYEGDQAYLLQHEDQRIVFVVPFHGYTMVGTTDVPFTGSLDDLSIETNEIFYLFSLINQYFKKQLYERDIIYTFSGVRSLLTETGKTLKAISRDYAYDFREQPAPAITIFSGKITTYRQLAMRAINQLRAIFPDLPKSRTHATALPGATLSSMDFSEYLAYAHEKYHWLDENTKERYLKNYGTRTEQILEGCQKMTDLGTCFTKTLYQTEVDYLISQEWAKTCDDILFRRTKLGLSIDINGQKSLAHYLSNLG